MSDKSDAEFLRGLATSVGPIFSKSDPERIVETRLREIADRCEQVAEETPKPSRLLENRVDRTLLKMVKTAVRCTEEGRVPPIEVTHLLIGWLIQRKL